MTRVRVAFLWAAWYPLKIPVRCYSPVFHCDCIWNKGFKEVVNLKSLVQTLIHHDGCPYEKRLGH